MAKSQSPTEAKPNAFERLMARTNSDDATNELRALSNQLDEAIKDVEDFLVGLHLGVEAKYSLGERRSEDGYADEFEYVAFRRDKSGWHLQFEVLAHHEESGETSVRSFPLLEASRARKVLALKHLADLIGELRVAAGNQAQEIREVLAHVKSVMANERGES